MILDFRFVILDRYNPSPTNVDPAFILAEKVYGKLTAPLRPFDTHGIEPVSIPNPKSQIPNPKSSDAAALRRPASIVRNRRRVTDGRYANSRLRNGTDRGLTAASKPSYANLDLTNTGLSGLARTFARSLLSGERRTLSRTAKTACTRGALRDEVPVRIRDRDEGVIERSRNVNDPCRDILLFLLLKGLFSWCFCHFLLTIKSSGRLSGELIAKNRRSTSTISCPAPSSWQRQPYAGPCGCGHSCSYAGLGPAGCGDGEGRGSSRCPSDA